MGGPGNFVVALTACALAWPGPCVAVPGSSFSQVGTVALVAEGGMPQG